MIWGIVNGVWGHHTNVSLRDMILKQRTGSTLVPDSLPHAASHPLDPNLTPFMLCPRDPYFILLPDPRPQLRGLLCPLASDWVWPVEVGGLGRAWPGSSLCSQSSSGPHEPARVPLCSLFLRPFPTLPFLVSAFFLLLLILQCFTDFVPFTQLSSLIPSRGCHGIPFNPHSTQSTEQCSHSCLANPEIPVCRHQELNTQGSMFQVSLHKRLS